MHVIITSDDLQTFEQRVQRSSLAMCVHVWRKPGDEATAIQVTQLTGYDRDKSASNSTTCNTTDIVCSIGWPLAGEGGSRWCGRARGAGLWQRGLNHSSYPLCVCVCVCVRTHEGKRVLVAYVQSGNKTRGEDTHVHIELPKKAPDTTAKLAARESEWKCEGTWR